MADAVGSCLFRVRAVRCGGGLHCDAEIDGALEWQRSCCGWSEDSLVRCVEKYPTPFFAFFFFFLCVSS